MKWLYLSLAVIAAVIALVWIIGANLPREHSVTRRARFKAPPQALYDTILAVERASEWRKELKRVELLPDRDGKPCWLEDASFGKVTFVRELADPPRRIVSRIANDDLPFGGQWTYLLEPDGGGTMLSITEDGFVKPALFRFLSRFVFGHTSTLDGYLRALAERHGESIEIGEG